MKVTYIVFVLTSFSIIKGALLASSGSDIFTPTFLTPDVDVSELSSCSDFFDCATDFIILLYQLVVAIFILLYNTLLLTAYLVTLMFITIPNAPWYVNVIIVGPFVLGLAIIVASLFKGDSTDV